jgi:hypothetical protein
VRALRILTLGSVVFLASAERSVAVTVDPCVSADNHLYLIITTPSANIGAQITSVGMNAGSPCSLSEIAPMGVLSAWAAGSGPLLPNRMRTELLSGFDNLTISCAVNFDPLAANGMGILQLPPQGNRTVSADPGSTTETLHPVTTATGTLGGPDYVPAAVDLNTSREIDGPIVCSGNGMVFPVGGVGTTVSDPTTVKSRISPSLSTTPPPRASATSPLATWLVLRPRARSRIATASCFRATAARPRPAN